MASSDDDDDEDDEEDEDEGEDQRGVGIHEGIHSIVNQKNSYGCERESQDLI
jgi:hypothetical protein